MCASYRLDSIAPDLVELGERLSERERQVVAQRVAEWACRISGVASYLGDARLGYLLNRDNAATEDERHQLNQDIEALDERCFALQDGDDETVNADDCLGWFSKARAVAALLYSLDSRLQSDFCEAIYEAHAATDDVESLRRLCQQHA